jgi:hypothetical protein
MDPVTGDSEQEQIQPNGGDENHQEENNSLGGFIIH